MPADTFRPAAWPRVSTTTAIPERLLDSYLPEFLEDIERILVLPLPLTATDSPRYPLQTSRPRVRTTERLQRSPTPISSSASPPSGGRWRPSDDVLLLADHFIRTLGAQMGKGDLKLSRACGAAAAVFSPRSSPREPPPLQVRICTSACSVAP